MSSRNTLDSTSTGVEVVPDTASRRAATPATTTTTKATATATATATLTTTTTTTTRAAAHEGLTSVGGLNGAAAKDRKRARKTSKYRHVAAVHSQSRPSCLSHDSPVAPSFLGFRNLMVIVLVVGNFRLMMENIQKYGVLICLRCHDFRSQDLFLGIVLYFSIPCHLLVAYLIELAVARSAQASRKRKVRASEKTFDDYNDNNNNNNNNNNNEKNTSGVDGVDGNEDAGPSEEDQRAFRLTWIVAAFLHGINITLALAITTFVVYFHVHHPLIGTLTELHAIIVWLKTASYAFTNRDLRHAYLHSSPSSSSSSSLASSSPPDKSTDIGATAADEAPAIPELYKSCPYPQNITMANLVYFWWAPTLVYQPVYPRTARVRWVFVAKRVCEIFCLGVFIWVASAQYAAPVLRNSLGKIASLDVFSILERLLKLSTISLAIWLAGFFALFQSFLNALAEVLRFGDRSFYDDWWNSESLGAYWRTWNKPVYTYFKRHVYVPMVGRGWSHGAASCAVFFVSAVLHEIAVGVPTHNIIGVAFLGMFLQLPLIAMTSPLEKMKLGHGGRILGNVIFWVSFTIFGQPFAALMYFYAWQAKYGSASRTMGGTSMSTSMSTSVGDSV